MKWLNDISLLKKNSKEKKKEKEKEKKKKKRFALHKVIKKNI